jgi:hypothetical protein
MQHAASSHTVPLVISCQAGPHMIKKTRQNTAHPRALPLPGKRKQEKKRASELENAVCAALQNLTAPRTIMMLARLLPLFALGNLTLASLPIVAPLHNRACEIPCGLANQFCCSTGQRCFTSTLQGIAYCSATVTPIAKSTLPPVCNGSCGTTSPLCCLAGQACITDERSVVSCRATTTTTTTTAPTTAGTGVAMSTSQSSTGTSPGVLGSSTTVSSAASRSASTSPSVSLCAAKRSRSSPRERERDFN